MKPQPCWNCKVVGLADEKRLCPSCRQPFYGGWPALRASPGFWISAALFAFALVWMVSKLAA